MDNSIREEILLRKSSSSDNATSLTAKPNEDGIASRKRKLEKTTVWSCLLTSSDGHNANVILLSWQWGTENGKMQKKERTYDKGKAGRTSIQQARSERNKMIKDKLHNGYVIAHSTFNITEEFDIEATDDCVPIVMLANKHSDHLDIILSPLNNVFVMPKLDGIFCLASLKTGKLWSRSRKPIIGVPHIQDAIKLFAAKANEIDEKGIKEKEIWIVGELYLHGMGFQTITGIVNRKKNFDQSLMHKIQYHVFDIIDTKLPFSKRRSLLEQMFTNYTLFESASECKPEIKLVRCDSINSELPPTANDIENCVIDMRPPGLCNGEQRLEKLAKWHDIYVSIGYEGLMLHIEPKNTGQSNNVIIGYQCGKRSNWLLKYKMFEQNEFTIVDINPQEFDKTVAGSVTLVDKDGNTFNASPSMTVNEQRDLLCNKHEYIGLIGSVKYFELTDRGVPRFPKFLGIRNPSDM